MKTFIAALKVLESFQLEFPENTLSEFQSESS